MKALVETIALGNNRTNYELANRLKKRKETDFSAL